MVLDSIRIYRGRTTLHLQMRHIAGKRTYNETIYLHGATVREDIYLKSSFLI